MQIDCGAKSRAVSSSRVTSQGTAVIGDGKLGLTDLANVDPIESLRGD